MKTKRVMGLFLALVMFMAYLPLNPIASYANDDININDAFPDKNFRDYVRRFDTDRNGNLSKVELDNVKKISINNQSISSLRGIEYFTNLTDLYCYENKLTSLDVSKNTKLEYFDCSYNKLTSLDVDKNINLKTLVCYENELTRLDVSKNTKLETLNCKMNPLTSLKLVRKEAATSSTYRIGLFLNPVKYTVKVEKGSKKVPFSRLPQGFDKTRIIDSEVQREDDGFTWNGSTNPIKFRYQLCENPNEVANPGIAIAGAEITVTEVEFNQDNIEDMKVKEQPKLNYTEEDSLNLTGLVVTLTDNQGLKRDVKFADFRKYKIKADPADGTLLTTDHNEKTVKLTRGDLQAETEKLTVNKVYTVTYTDGVDGQEIFKNQVTSGILSGTDTPKFNGTPSRDGYVFSGWTPDVANKVTVNATYTATWKEDKNHNGTADEGEDKYTVTYTDGVDGQEIFKNQVTSGILSGTDTPKFNGTPSRDGYVFSGWTPDVANKVTVNATYTATWKEDHFTVTFKDGDKTQTVKVETGKAIDTDALTDQSMPNDPTKAGYTFKEWNTKEDGKGEKFTGASVVNGDMTVHAIYTQDSVPTPELKPKPKPEPKTPAPKPEPKPEPKTPAPKSQSEKHIDMIPQTGESASFAGLLAALGFSIVGLAILRKKKMMEENNK